MSTILVASILPELVASIAADRTAMSYKVEGVAILMFWSRFCISETEVNSVSARQLTTRYGMASSQVTGAQIYQHSAGLHALRSVRRRCESELGSNSLCCVEVLSN